MWTYNNLFKLGIFKQKKGINWQMKDVIVRPRLLASGKTVYEYRFEMAKVGGRRQWKTRSGFKTKTEAKLEGRKALQSYESAGQLIESVDMSFSDYLDMWLKDDVELSCVTSTVQGYKKKIRLYIKPKLGMYTMTALNKSLLQDFIVCMYNDGFSLNTISSVRGILTKSLLYAADNHYVTVNPATNLKVPKTLKPKKRTRSKPHVYIMEDKMQQIFERFPIGTTGYLPLLIGYRTGLRLSEIFALVWDDIDFKNKTLTVNRQVLWKDVPRDEGDVKRTNGTSESNGFWYFVPPKYKSYRTISLDDNLVEILKAEKVKQDKAKAYYDEYYEYYYAEDELVFDGGVESRFNNTLENRIGIEKTRYEVDFVLRRENGSYTTSRITQHICQVVHKKLDFPEFDMHSLRHTHATMLMENGADIVYIQKRLGHKDAAVTMRIYVNHMTPKLKDKNDKTLNRMYVLEYDDSNEE